jgi:hypothetical protein
MSDESKAVDAITAAARSAFYEMQRDLDAALADNDRLRRYAIESGLAREQAIDSLCAVEKERDALHARIAELEAAEAERLRCGTGYGTATLIRSGGASGGYAFVTVDDEKPREFKVGDRVRVRKKGSSCICWICEIDKIRDGEASLFYEEGFFWVPLCDLEHVDDEKEVTR